MKHSRFETRIVVLSVLLVFGLVFLLLGTRFPEGTARSTFDHVGTALVIASLVFLVDQLMGWLQERADVRQHPNLKRPGDVDLLGVFSTRLDAQMFITRELGRTKSLKWMGTGGYDARLFSSELTNLKSAQIILQEPSGDAMRLRALLEEEKGPNESPTSALPGWIANIERVRQKVASTNTATLRLNPYVPLCFLMITDDFCLVTPYWADTNDQAPTFLFRSRRGVGDEYEAMFDRFWKKLGDVAHTKTDLANKALHVDGTTANTLELS